MEASGNAARKGLGLLIWAVMLSLSVAIPILERAEISAEPVAESEHNPATCPPAHDHTLCTQVSTQLLASSGGSTCAVMGTVLGTALRPEMDICVARTPLHANPSRAPPFLA